MNHVEFREKILSLTDTELKIKSGEFTNEEFLNQVLLDAVKDENGYYFFSNQKMTKPQFTDGYPLRPTLSYAGSLGKLRLIIHTRFTELPFHYDEFISINYVYSGKMIVRFTDGLELTLTRGMMILMNKNIVHSIRLTDEEDMVFGIQIQTEYMKKELLFGLEGSGIVIDFLLKSVMGEKSDFTYTLFHFDENSNINFIFEEMFCEYLDPGSCGETLIQNYMKILFIQLIRSSDQHMNNFRDSRITNILHFIEEHSRDCTLDMLANEFGFNPKYISSLLKDKTGKSFTELLTESRMKSICYLLVNTDLSIREISYSCGYSNHTFFYQKFVSMHNMSPKEYRNQHRTI